MDMYVAEILFGGFLLLLLLGAPITVALGGAAMGAYVVLDKDPIALVQIAFNSVGSFPLMALPAFVLAGALMEAAGISRRLVDIAEALAGPITGGLGVATVMACLFFGAISGSGPATTAAVGMLMIPAMTKRNYDRAYASAVTAASGGLGIIIPPSIPMVIFGIAALGMEPPPEAVEKFGSFASLSIPKLFVAGVMPGLVMAASLLVMNHFISKKRGYRGLSENWSGGDLKTALKRGVWSILAPVIILGGIYAGLFTPTEAAAVAVVYGLFIGMAIHRTIRVRDLFPILRDAAETSGIIMIVMGLAGIFAYAVNTLGMADPLVAAIRATGLDSMATLVLVIGLLVLVGTVLDGVSIMLVFLPLLYPLSRAFQWDPVWFGVVLTMAVAIGQFTPPMAVNLMVSCRLAGVRIDQTIPWVSWLLVSFLAATLVVAFVPSLALWLPRVLGY